MCEVVSLLRFLNVSDNCLVTFNLPALAHLCPAASVFSVTHEHVTTQAEVKGKNPLTTRLV